MNMISTAFPTEVDASSSKNKLVASLVSTWEKKNSKAARAGGVSLMALSLAACGAEDETPFAQSDIDAATAPLSAAVIVAEAAQATAETAAATALVAQATAETAAATALVGKAAAEATAATALVGKAAADTAAATALVAKAAADANVVTANAATAAAQAATAVAEAATAVAEASLLAANTAKAASDASLATVQASYDALIAPVSAALTTALTDVVSGRTGNDTVTGTNLTYNAGDLIADASSADADVLTISVNNADLAAGPIVTNFETVTIDVTSVLAGTTPLDFSMDAANISGMTALNVNATNASTLINSLNLSNLKSTTVNADTEFATVTIAANNNATYTVNSAATVLTVNAAVGNVTDLTADVTTTAVGTITTDADGTVTVTTAGNTTVNAVDAAIVKVTSAANATVNANDVLANAVNVTTGEEAIITANSAETVTLTAGDGIDAASATAIASSLTSSNTNSITVNVSGNGAATSLDLTGAATVNNVAVSGDQDVTVQMSMATVDALGSTTASTADDNLVTVSDTSTAGSTTLSFTAAGGDVDTSSASVNFVNVAADLGAADDITVASGTAVTVSVNQTAADLALVAKTSTAVDNSVSITASNDASAGTANDLNGVTLTNFATATLTAADTTTASGLGAVTAAGTALTVETGAFGFDTIGAVNLGAGVLTVNGGGGFNSGTNNVTAGSIQAGNSTGVINVDLKGAGTTGTVVTGSGNDVISVTTATRTAGDYVITTGSGTDGITIAIDEGYTIDMGTGTDTLTINAALDLSDNTVSLAGIENVATTINNQVLTLSAAGFATDNIFTLTGQTGGTDGLTVTGTANADNVDMSYIVTANDADLIINGGLSGDTLTGSATNITTINGGGGNDIITGGTVADVLNGDAGNDIIVTGAGGDAADGGANNDTITGGSGADTLTGGTGADTLTGGLAGDTYVIGTGHVIAGDSIVELAAGTGNDILSATTDVNASLMTAASFDNIEVVQLASGVDITLTSAQVTAEAFALTGAGGTETVTINMSSGETLDNSNLTFATWTAGTDTITVNGSVGNETMTGSLANETVNLGAGVDTFKFGATAALNGVDGLTVVAGAAGDILDLSAFMAAGATVSNTLTLGLYVPPTAIALSTSAGSIAIGNKALVIKAAFGAGNNAASEIVTLLTNTNAWDAVDVAINSSALIFHGADNGTAVRVWGIQNDGTAAISAGDITLLATLTTTADTVDLLAAVNIDLV